MPRNPLVIREHTDPAKITAEHDACMFIPYGYFKDSVFAWYDNGGSHTPYRPDYKVMLRESEDDTPAPTAQEILGALPLHIYSADGMAWLAVGKSEAGHTSDILYTVEYSIRVDYGFIGDDVIEPYRDLICCHTNLAQAALQLWHLWRAQP